ncbi:hypothetical protein L1987_59710 [Smallanthus sonchifolius]|uniref:Uncharacterized protein n=1 Tax=Smallanthus sonchifolius TaxID=185202 RepID=A0ACB9D6R4_9ASTR|nr:hypothetical protein L1987_59710 [Smallanthus sonchifolius]
MAPVRTLVAIWRAEGGERVWELDGTVFKQGGIGELSQQWAKRPSRKLWWLAGCFEKVEIGSEGETREKKEDSRCESKAFIVIDIDY